MSPLTLIDPDFNLECVCALYSSVVQHILAEGGLQPGGVADALFYELRG